MRGRHVAAVSEASFDANPGRPVPGIAEEPRNTVGIPRLPSNRNIQSQIIRQRAFGG
jgi:hypothetical protein